MGVRVGVIISLGLGRGVWRTECWSISNELFDMEGQQNIVHTELLDGRT